MDDFKPAKRPAKSLHGLLDVVQRTPTPTHQTFRTPEEVAAADDIKQPATLVDQAQPEPSPDSHHQAASGGGGRSKPHFNWPPGRREWIIIAVIVLLIGGGLAWAMSRHPSMPAIVKKHTVKPVPKPAMPTTEPSKLTGLPVNPIVNLGPITGVMVENSLDARPQSGLSQAGVVFEAVAEGGVTRFLALFEDTGPDNVGPIRSARPYYVSWSMGFDAGYAHVGGSPDALADIKTWGVRDLDQFANSGSYHRISSRAAPHNVYTSMAQLNQLEFAKGYNRSNFTGFVRKPKDTPSAKIIVHSIDLSLSGSLYDPHFSYSAATNSYDRSENGAPQIDANTNKQLSPKVVIAMITPKAQGALDSSGAYYSDYQFIGTGSVFIYQDGFVQTGGWTKRDNASQITFTDAAGKPIALNPGQTWITAVSGPDKVTATP